MEFLIVPVVIILYFLPFLVGILRRGDLDPEVRKFASRLGRSRGRKYVRRRMPHLAAIYFLNLLLGWTGIGWIAALVWAATARVNYDDWELTVPVEDRPSKILDASGVPYAQPHRPAPVEDKTPVEDRAKEVREIKIVIAFLVLFVLIVVAPVLLAA